MKRTKTNVVKVLQAMSKNLWDCAKYEEEENGKSERYYKLARESWAYDDAIKVITRKDYFDKMVNVYFHE